MYKIKRAEITTANASKSVTSKCYLSVEIRRLCKCHCVSIQVLYAKYDNVLLITTVAE